MQVISSLLDNDFYKFLMHSYALEYGRGEEVEYTFFDRGNTFFTKEMYDEIKEEIKKASFLEFTSEELAFLKSFSVFSPIYLNFLENSTCLKKSFGYSSFLSLSNIKLSYNKGKINLKIKGLWHECTLWEIPLLAIISEIYTKHINKSLDIENTRERILQKFDFFKKNKITYAEFGTRRRASKQIQELVNINLPSCYTSNLLMAKKYDKKIVGTQPHELYMFLAAKKGYKDAYSIGIMTWFSKFFEPTILTDTFTSDYFFDFIHSYLDSKQKEYSFRQDSGDPILFVDKCQSYFPDKKIKIIFSDNLNIKKIERIIEYLKDKPNIIPNFGIGTNLTNDVEGSNPLNIVIKLTKVDGVSTVKLSDHIGKTLGSSSEIRRCKKELGIH